MREGAATAAARERWRRGLGTIDDGIGFARLVGEVKQR
jgi:hypothetical protein